MTEIRNDPCKIAQQTYRELPPADKAVFQTILNLALLLLKPQLSPPTTEPKKEVEDTQ